MIRFLFFCASLITAFCGGFLLNPLLLSETVYSIDNEITYYVENVTDSRINYIDAGIFKIVTLKGDADISGKFSKIYGKSFKLKTENENLNKLQNIYRYNVITTEKINNITIIYCYTPLIKDFKIVAGKKVNMQISLNTEYITVGIPLILGSY